jgi:hypothetical protein
VGAEPAPDTLDGDARGAGLEDPEGGSGGADTQARVIRYLEGVDPEEVVEAARRYDEYPESQALALGRIERARIAAEQADDGAAVDALLALRDLERGR